MKLSEQIISLTQDPNILGELLRDKFFNQDRERGKLGCYSTFELRPDVIKLEDRLFDKEDESTPTIHSAQLDDIRMEYYWDGDGLLSFFFPDGQEICNDDCKKTHSWFWY